jgi:hypothetical protein
VAVRREPEPDRGDADGLARVLPVAGVRCGGSDCVSDDLGDQQFNGVGQGRHPPLMKNVLGV